MHSLRVELRTSRLLNGCSNQLSYDCYFACHVEIAIYILVPAYSKSRYNMTEFTATAGTAGLQSAASRLPGALSVIGTSALRVRTPGSWHFTLLIWGICPVSFRPSQDEQARGACRRPPRHPASFSTKAAVPTPLAAHLALLRMHHYLSRPLQRARLRCHNQ